MPQFEEPVPAQNQIRQARGETSEEHPPQKRASLLQRLANVGLAAATRIRAADRSARLGASHGADASAARAQAAASGSRRVRVRRAGI
jgi:cell division protein FtsZ